MVCNYSSPHLPSLIILPITYWAGHSDAGDRHVAIE